MGTSSGPSASAVEKLASMDHGSEESKALATSPPAGAEQVVERCTRPIPASAALGKT